MNKAIVFIVVGALVMAMLGFAFAATSQTTAATATVNEFLSVTLSNVPVTFPSMDPGVTANANVGNGFPLNATLGAETNVNANVTTEANQTNFVSGSNTFAVSNMEWSATSTFPGTNYTTSPATVCSGLTANGKCGIYHRLAIPAAQAAGTYQVGVKVSAVKT